MKSSKKPNKKELIDRLLNHGVDRVIEKTNLARALNSGKKLRVKLGIDPTAPDLHLGHAAVLRKLREFQDLGHKVVFIIGDYTAKIGDPSGRSKERKVLSDKEIRENMREYLVQAGKIINLKKTETRHNSEWLSKNVGNILELTRSATINQLAERSDFRDRIKKGQSVSFLEALYALFQGFDSVNIKADVELGGNDQLLNLLMGRQVQRHFGQKEQDILTIPLLVGTDGSKKMSKSENNYISLRDSAENMFGKLMSINDKAVFQYFELCTDADKARITKLKSKFKGAGKRDIKMELANEIVTMYHGSKAAASAMNGFEKVFGKKEAPSKIQIKALPKLSYSLLDLLIAASLANSKNEAKRLISQGGVRVNGVKELSQDKKIQLGKSSILLQVGKKRFLNVKSK